jgi:ATP-dependent helicase HrpB
VQAASRLLYLLGAIEAAAGSASLTELGRKMVELPVHPRLARVLLEAERRGVVGQAVNAVVEMSDGRVELRDRLLSAMRARSVPVGVDDSVDLRFSVLCGFPDRVGRKRKNEFLLCSGGAARIDSSLSDAFSEYAVAVDVEERKAHGQIRPETYLRAVYPIEADWLLELTPSMLKDADEFTWTGERVEAVSRLKYDQLMITESRESARDRRGVAEFLAKQVWAGGLARICDVERLENLRARMAFIRQHVGGEFLALNDEEVLRLLTEFCEGKISLSEVRDGDFLAYILAVFPADQFKVLERDAPEAVVLKRGRRVRVHYENDKPPWIESRLQDFFGMPSGPVLAGGRVPLTLHLLAPNQRAVQVTSDLAGFWARNYPALRKELGRRYPRHAWPEDPL